jgi:hypothetical protein
MYAVYFRTSDDGITNRRPVIIAMYARRGGAMKRAEEASNSLPGVSYFVAVLPEGSSPQFDSLTDRVAAFIVTEPNGKHDLDTPEDLEDLPF